MKESLGRPPCVFLWETGFPRTDHRRNTDNNRRCTNSVIRRVRRCAKTAKMRKRDEVLKRWDSGLRRCVKKMRKRSRSRVEERQEQSYKRTKNTRGRKKGGKKFPCSTTKIPSSTTAKKKSRGASSRADQSHKTMGEKLGEWRRRRRERKR